MGFNIQQYELGITKKDGNWSNATGDVADLKQKIKGLQTNLDYLEERWTLYNADYDRCRSIKKDKDRNACLASRQPDVITADANRTKVRRELDEAKNDLAIEIKRVSDEKATTGGGGTTTGGGNSTTTGGGTTAKKSNTVLYASIGGAVLILGVVGYFVFKKN